MQVLLEEDEKRASKLCGTEGVEDKDTGKMIGAERREGRNN